MMFHYFSQTIKKKLAILLVAINFSICIQARDNFITLTSPALKFIDGIRGFMDEHKIHKILWMGQKISEILYGIFDSHTKQRKPQYSFNGKLYNLQQLIELEKSGKDMSKVLVLVKENFEKVTGPFFKESHGSEEYMADLIEESCRKRHRMDSLLIKWSQDMLQNKKDKKWYDGIEHEAFRKNVTTLRLVDVFCTDLTTFLKDLVNSCPKALDRYQKWIKQQHKSETVEVTQEQKEGNGTIAHHDHIKDNALDGHEHHDNLEHSAHH